MNRIRQWLNCSEKHICLAIFLSEVLLGSDEIHYIYTWTVRLHPMKFNGCRKSLFLLATKEYTFFVESNSWFVAYINFGSHISRKKKAFTKNHVIILLPPRIQLPLNEEKHNRNGDQRFWLDLNLCERLPEENIEDKNTLFSPKSQSTETPSGPVVDENPEVAVNGWFGPHLSGPLIFVNPTAKFFILW